MNLETKRGINNIVKKLVIDKDGDDAAADQAVDDEVDAAIEDDEEPGSVVTDDGAKADAVLKPSHVTRLYWKKRI